MRPYYVYFGIIAFILAGRLVAPSAIADTIVVDCADPNGITTIQAGLNAAGDGDTVVLMPCVYRETITFPNRAITLTSLDPMDPNTVAATIINGDLDQDPNTANGTVVTFASGEAERVLTGLTITGGRTPGWPGPSNGGGINGAGASNITISRSTITGNSASDSGGGLYNCDGDIQNCTISGNSAYDDGGGLSWCGGNIQNCTISGNSAYSGGGLYYCYANIRNCTISGNSARYGGGMMSCYVSIQNCTISGNVAFHEWGDAYGGGAYNSRNISNCTITQNLANHGSGLSNCTKVLNSHIVGNGIWYDSAYDSYTGGGLHDCNEVRNCLISGNMAGEGGGLYAVTQVTGCTISRNSGDTGTALHSGWTNTSVDSSIIWYDSVDDPYTQVTIQYSDIAGGWGGLGNIDEDPLFADSHTGVWTIPGMYNVDAGQTTLVDVTGTWENDVLAGSVINPDVSQNSHFVIAYNTPMTVAVWGNASFVDSGTVYEIYDYHLQADPNFQPISPCIDAGNPNLYVEPDERDLGGYSRVLNHIVDMGAYEHSPDCNRNSVPDWLELSASVVAADNAADAMFVCPGETYSGTTTDVTNDGAASCGYSESSPDVWYTYTPDSAGQVVISLCGSVFDTVLSVHSDVPGTMANELACNDDECGVQSELTLDVYAGFTYYIRIAGYDGVTGDFQIELDGPACIEPHASDCNGNDVPDECDIADGTSWDCDDNGVPDECEYEFSDCNGNELPDHCDILGGSSEDCNVNNVPDECDLLPVFDLGPPTSYSTYSTPYGVTAADVDNDGDPDLAVADYLCASVLLNNGDGTFAPYADFPVMEGARAIAADDFDDDGFVDLATANGSSDTVSVLLNNGQDVGGEWLGFAEAVDYVVGSYPYALAVGDLDNDGNPELIVVNYSSHTISVLPNAGHDGASNWLGFATPVDYPVGNNPRSVAVGHLDTDDYLDVAVSDGDGYVSVLINKQTGLLKPAVSYDSGRYYAKGLTIADLDSDGAPDLAVTVADGSWDIGAAAIFMNYGDGTFGDPSEYLVGRTPGPLVAGLFDNDGYLDLVVGNYNTDDVSVLLNIGDGTFAEQVVYAVPPSPLSMVPADFDDDNRLDVAVGTYNGVSVLMNQSAATSQDANSNGIPDECEGLMLGDLNCDGSINSLDIDPFVLALTSTPPNYPEYYAEHPDCDVMLADCNCDGSINSIDIDVYVDLLAGAGACCLPGSVCELKGSEQACLDAGGTYLGDHTNCWCHQDRCPLSVGDMNCDGSVNSLDIDPFVLSLTSTPPDYPEYYAEHPDCDHTLADCNYDGSVNSLDIDIFVELLTGG